MQKGFIALPILALIILGVVGIAGGGYAISKYNKLASEKALVESKLNEQKNIEIQRLQEQVNQNDIGSSTTETSSMDTGTASAQATSVKQVQVNKEISLQTQSSIPNDVDWRLADSILPTMRDTLNTYKSGSLSIKDTVNEGLDTQATFYNLLSMPYSQTEKQQFLQYIDHSKQYTDSGSELVVWLNTAVTYYGRLISAIENRDADQYHITSALIDAHEAKKNSIITEFESSEMVAKSYAAQLLVSE